MADHRRCTARNETPLERADRSFVELLQELRVTQTGVQILFAFLLSLAFTSRFPELDTVQGTVCVTTLLFAVLAAMLFTAPAAPHRSLFQRGAKACTVRVSSRLATSGHGRAGVRVHRLGDARGRRDHRPGRRYGRRYGDAAGLSRPVVAAPPPGPVHPRDR
jgi:hypothetical protein